MINARRSPRWRLAEGIFRLMTKAYPPALRRIYGRELAATLGEWLADSARQGRAATWRFWRDACRDFVVSAAAAWYEHGRARRHARDARTPLHRKRKEEPMDSLRQDVRYAFRRLRRSPAFTLGVLSILALSIGANAALFSVVDAVLLRPLPVPEPDRLVTLWESVPAKGISQFPMSRGNFGAVRERGRSFAEVAGLRRVDVALTAVDQPRRIAAALTTAPLLPMLGIEPLLGRGISAADERPDAARVCVLSHRLWRSAFAGDPAVLGRTVILEGLEWSVIGVLPSAVPLHEDVDAWIQLRMDPAAPSYWDNREVEVIARLRDGVSVEQAGAEVAALGRQLVDEQPDWNGGMSAYLRPLHQQLVGDVRVNLLILLGAVACVLAIACVNVAGLLLARGAERGREIAMRSALGAGRGRVLRQLLTESLILSLGAGLLGLGVAYAAVSSLGLWAPGGVPRLAEVSVDARVAAFAFAVAVLTGLTFGLLPALRTSRTALTEALGQTRSALGERRASLRSALVVAEVALAAVLLVGSGLLLRSFVLLNRVDPGCETADRMSMWLSLPATRYAETDQVSSFFGRLQERLESLPGVVSASAATSLPLTDSTYYKWMSLEDRPPRSIDEIPGVHYTVVQPEYFATMGIALRAGRTFAPGDDARSPWVAVVNETFVRRHYGDRQAIGRRVIMGPPPELEMPGLGEVVSPVYTIVGVVADVSYGRLGGEVPPQIYVPIDQPDADVGSFYVVVRTTVPPESLTRALYETVWESDPELPVSRVRTMEGVAAAAVARPRLNLTLIGAFALAALFLSAAGLYALLSFSVAQRTRELGVRMAVGAGRGEIVRLVVGQGARLSLIGIVAGVAAAAVFSRVLDSLLFGVTATDPVTFVAVAAFLALVTLAAGLLPAFRASRLSPIEALRCE